MNTSLDSVRADVKFALTCQPGQWSPAINGIGDVTYSLSFFFRRVPDGWIDGIANRLFRVPWHHDEFKYDIKGEVGAKCVDALEFHEWVAYQVKEADPMFEYKRIDPRHSDYANLNLDFELDHQMRKDQALAIRDALDDWVHKGGY